jgi:hypothetical protein
MASPLNFEVLQNTVENCSITTIEDVLSRLPDDYQSRYALVYNSRSLQGATPENPRVISFGTDASFILAFNNDPTLMGHDKIETISFDHPSARFIFREIQFPGAAQKPVVSEENPALCLTCHRKDPRPNWDGYFIWPGTYGAEEDALFDLKTPAAASDYPAERAIFAKYNPSVGRYAYLNSFLNPGPQPSSLPADFIDFTSEARHNLGLSTFVGEQNGERIARIISELPLVNPYRYLFLAATVCIPPITAATAISFQDWNDLSTFVPDGMKNQFPLTQLQTAATADTGGRTSFVNRVLRHFQLEGITACEDQRIENVYAIPGQSPIDPTEDDYGGSPDSDDFSISNTLWALQPFGASMLGWSTEFVGMKDISYSFHMIASSMGGAQRALWLRYFDPVADAELKDDFASALASGDAYNSVYFDQGSLPRVCSILRQKSIKNLSQINRY